MNSEPDDEIFMARFNNRFSLEPAPRWARPPRPTVPWLEIGWALAGALLLSLYWPELHFGWQTVYHALPVRWGFTLLAAGLFLAHKLAAHLTED